MTRISRYLLRCTITVLLVGTGAAQTASKNLAPGFTDIQVADKVVILPVDVELFSLSAGGVAEPRADWTAAAQEHMKSQLKAKTTQLGLNTSALESADADEFAEQIGLHAAVARSIELHHSIGGAWALPSKEGKLDWSFGQAMSPLREHTGARYGLFVWVRDSYASAKRKVTMFVLAALGVGITGGAQFGYASLVDLHSDQVVWFNRLPRGAGDLREAGAAGESMDALLADSPAVRP